MTERPKDVSEDRSAAEQQEHVADMLDLAAEMRDQAAEQRDDAAEKRDDAAEKRDDAAEKRDDAAEKRDDAAERFEAQATAQVGKAALARAALARQEAAADRRQASQDRALEATERTRASLDRDDALADRGASAKERERGELLRASFKSFVESDVQLGLLGSFSLRINAEPLALPMNAQRLVTFLALHDGLLQRQHVAGSLWGDTTERRAAGSLRSALWRLGHPTHPLVEVADPHMRLSPTVAVDVRLSEALALRVLDDSQDLSEADLDGALLSMDLLPDWTEDWVLVKREHHTQLRLRALEALCRRLSAMGRHGEAVQAGMQAVSGEPLRESAQRSLIAAHIAEGNSSAAVKQYDSFRELLRDELGLEPSPEMQTLVKGLNR